jgi:hypothetical protein
VQSDEAADDEQASVAQSANGSGTFTPLVAATDLVLLAASAAARADHFHGGMLDTGSLISLHAGHFDSSLAAGLPILAVAATMTHSHAPVYLTAAVSTVSAVSIEHVDSPFATALGDTAFASTHGTHSQTTAKVDPPSKLVPKRCTTTASGGVLITSVDGKRQCDCDAKAKAAEEIKEQLANKELAQGQAVGAAPANCLPCQGLPLADDLAGQLASCAFPVSGEFSLAPHLNLDHVGDEACPAKYSFAAEQAAAAELQWLHGLQIAGLSLLAASVAFVPTRRSKPDEESHDDATQLLIQRLFGRLHVERLVR